MKFLLIIGGFFLLIIGGFWACFWALGMIIKIFSGERSSTPSRHSSTYRTTSIPNRKDSKVSQTFRPSGTKRTSPTISFSSSSTTGAVSPISESVNLDGLHDAFTGAPLNKALGLFQCQLCQVFYHSESVQVLREANSSKCVSCHSTSIISIVPDIAPSMGKDYTPSVVTLTNFRKHVGSVVTFEGYVHKVNESRRGDDFAVMFEDKSWVKGFKLVFFRGAARKIGGRLFMHSLRGKTVRVRGLIVNHERFGYEIIVSEKSMIINIK